MFVHLFISVVLFLMTEAHGIVTGDILKQRPDIVPDLYETVETFKHLLQKYSQELTSVKDELSDTRNENRELRKSITYFKTEVTQLKQTSSACKETLERNTREITQLKLDFIKINANRMDSIQTCRNASDLSKDPTEHSNVMPTGKATKQSRGQLVSSDWSNATKHVIGNTPNAIGGSEFYARLGKKFEVKENEQTIIYDVTVTDTAFVYNNKTGIFTCNTSGVYVFSWTTLVTADHYIETILRRNQGDLGLTYSGSTGFPGSGSQTVVAHLQQGDNVQVKVGSYTAGSILYDLYTTFAGYRVQ